VPWDFAADLDFLFLSDLSMFKECGIERGAFRVVKFCFGDYYISDFHE
jgi:hypothetical protein